MTEPEKITAGRDLTIKHMAELTRLRAQRDQLREALEFYANPETYHAPCGEFMDDFSEDEWTKECGYRRPMPGKRARAAVAAVEDRHD